MITLSITEYIVSVLFIPLCILSVYYLNRIGFFYDEEEVKKINFITLSADEGKKEQ